MAWTAPRTWVAAEVPTAVMMNAHIRDNMLAQDAATAQTAGDLIYADAANSMGGRLAIGSPGNRLVSTGTAPVWRGTAYAVGNSIQELSGLYTSWIDLGGGEDIYDSAHPTYVDLETGTQAVVYYGARWVSNDSIGENVQLSYRVLGASSIAASVNWGVASESDAASEFRSVFRVNYQTGLTAGVNRFVVTVQSSGGVTARINYPWIMVKAL